MMRKLDDFDREQRRRELARLSPRHRVAFAASIAERLLPNYAAFAREYGWGNPATLREGLEVAWAVVSGADVPQGRLLQLRQDCEAVVPDSEDYPAAITSAAIDAGNAVCEVLACCMDGSADRAADVANFAYDTVHMHLQEIHDLDYDDPAFDGRILLDPLMQRELQHQEAAMQLLERNPDLSDQTIQELRTAWSNRGLSNIDLQ